MAVRTAYDPTAGEVLTAVNLEKMAGGWIGYEQVITNQGPFGPADTDLTGLSVAVTVGAGRRIRVSCLVTLAVGLAAGRLHLNINEGATVLQHSEEDQGLNGYTTVELSAVLTPTAGVHTYKLQAGASTGTTATLSASATGPAYILVEDLGSA